MILAPLGRAVKFVGVVLVLPLLAFLSAVLFTLLLVELMVSSLLLLVFAWTGLPSSLIKRRSQPLSMRPIR